MFVFKSQYIPNTCLLCVEFVSYLYSIILISILGLYLCIGIYGMYSYVFAIIRMYLQELYIGMYFIVFACIVCIKVYCKDCLYLYWCVLMCICGMYWHV